MKLFELDAKPQPRIRPLGHVCQQCGKRTRSPKVLTHEQVYKLLNVGIVPKYTYHKLCETCSDKFDVTKFSARYVIKGYACNALLSWCFLAFSFLTFPFIVFSQSTRL